MALSPLVVMLKSIWMLKNDKNGVTNAFNPANEDKDNTKVQLADDSRIKLAVQWQNKGEDGPYITAVSSH